MPDETAKAAEGPAAPEAAPEGRPAPTGERILAALVDVLLEGGLPEFSVQEVADRAGVSHRTVYRHFPTRESLLEGLTEWVDARMRARGGVMLPASAGEIPAAARTNFALFSADARAVEAAVRFGVGAAIEPRGRAARTGIFRELVARDLGGVGDADAALGAAVVRQVASSRTWLGLLEAGLGPDDAGRAASWAAAVLLDALRGGRVPSAEGQTPAPPPHCGPEARQTPGPDGAGDRRQATTATDRDSGGNDP
ncbi:MAG TPA: TetR/AcrR family transcriptional regulator [Thermoanaerobaculia bacterium]|nr:TetR/AcrR family transcriptional regulator [Thermoanaerobaculia bacterium]